MIRNSAIYKEVQLIGCAAGWGGEPAWAQLQGQPDPGTRAGAALYWKETISSLSEGHEIASDGSIHYKSSARETGRAQKWPDAGKGRREDKSNRTFAPKCTAKCTAILEGLHFCKS